MPTATVRYRSSRVTRKSASPDAPTLRDSFEKHVKYMFKKSGLKKPKKEGVMVSFTIVQPKLKKPPRVKAPVLGYKVFRNAVLVMTVVPFKGGYRRASTFLSKSNAKELGITSTDGTIRRASSGLKKRTVKRVSSSRKSSSTKKRSTKPKRKTTKSKKAKATRKPSTRRRTTTTRKTTTRRRTTRK